MFSSNAYNMRLTLSFLVLFAVFVGGCSGAPAGSDRFVSLKIYHTNDVHSHLLPDARGRGGLAYLASVLRVVREQEPEALILDAGDYYKKGSLPAQKTHDEVTADILAQMPYYDLRAVGNNEIKVGLTRLLEFAKKKEHAPVIAANLVDKNGKSLFPPQYILKKNGLTIGVIGMTPPIPIDNDSQADPKKDSRAPYKTVSAEEAVVPAIKNLRPHVDVLILLAHNVYKDNVKLAHDHPEIDLVVSGHSHVLTPDQKIQGRGMVVEAGEFGAQIGVATVVYDRVEKKVTSEESTFWPIGVDMQLPDKRIAQQIDDDYKKYAPEAKNVIGKAEGPLTLVDYRTPFEGALHDWVADTFCERVACDLALVNREMLREMIQKGNITVETLSMAAPYEDQISVVQLPRKTVQDMLTDSLKRYYDGAGMMGWAFAKARVSMRVDLKNQKIKSVALKLSSPKGRLKVVMPNYVVTHCSEFFKASYCPLNGAVNAGDVRTILNERIEHEKKVIPPTLDRVSVSEVGTENAEAVSDDSGDVAEPDEDL